MKWPVIILSIIVIAGGIWFLQSRVPHEDTRSQSAPSSQTNAAPEPYPVNPTPPPADATVNKKTP
jgi:hypothetical protein